MDTRRLSIFLGFAFGIAWLFALIIFVTGGLVNSPELIPGTGISLALVLSALGTMMAPALANILTRMITREGTRELWLKPHFRRSWRYWIAAWITPAVLTAAGTALYFVLFPIHFDPSLSTLRRTLDASGQSVNVTTEQAWVFVALGLVQAILLAPIINSLFTFGEEFGWRAYLLPKLLSLGERRAVIVLGIIRGIWHWPHIAMGHNYGLNYPGMPWSGMLMFVWIAMLLSVFLSFITLRAGSVWPAVIGHAAINGVGGLSGLFVTGEPNTLLGPYVSGFIAALPRALLAIILLLMLKPEPRNTAQQAMEMDVPQSQAA